MIAILPGPILLDAVFDVDIPVVVRAATASPAS